MNRNSPYSIYVPVGKLSHKTRVAGVVGESDSPIIYALSAFFDHSPAQFPSVFTGTHSVIQSLSSSAAKCVLCVRSERKSFLR